ncbi:flagellar assembly peptidoglycan hydrolase FlgJ [Azospira restricta]|uniref:Peptidoglycan hydrolase FlgJ n=1 Tax=Azospira restricta TaxID=404405 RepID=A0A974SSC6_9RHOO|nr:flagellar assembly peptidoglycan hydrolase FlgJ [Azospira restricta]QRJ65458.1 flagellar assembly peptidoglycan hydrolase FlgJ [Azospira restricta]
MKPEDIASQRFVLDLKSTQDLRAKIQQDPKAGLKQAAQQFEGMFLQMVMKSMRDATPSDGLFNSDATRFYTSVLDQQLAQQLGASGQVGFARLIEAQLGRTLGVTSADAVPQAAAVDGLRAFSGRAAIPAGAIVGAERVAGRVAGEAAAAAATLPVAPGPLSQGARDFVNRVWPHAVEASRSTGVPAHFLVAHAALESGWGKSEIRRGDGSSSHNLFGIKAGRSWQGESVEAATTEYVNGVAQPAREKFRAYGSYAEAFRDYATLLSGNPRFAGVLGQQDGTAFARSLQQAGYATDPMYADKLSRIINGSTLRQALVG